MEKCSPFKGSSNSSNEVKFGDDDDDDIAMGVSILDSECHVKFKNLPPIYVKVKSIVVLSYITVFYSNFS